MIAYREWHARWMNCHAAERASRATHHKRPPRKHAKWVLELVLMAVLARMLPQKEKKP